MDAERQAGGETQFVALAVSTDISPPASPCGMCRQFIREFCALDMPVFMFGVDEADMVRTLGEVRFYYIYFLADFWGASGGVGTGRFGGREILNLEWTDGESILVASDEFWSGGSEIRAGLREWRARVRRDQRVGI